MADLRLAEIDIQQEDSDYIRVTAGPLEAGFGTTLGNAMRRVLLSSLPGAAIYAVRGEHIQHEFQTIPGIREDLIELMLNLKEVRLRANADRQARMTLDSKGKGVLTAADIQTTADYEIVNPDLVICHVDDADASLSIELFVQTGRGYIPSDQLEQAGETVSIGLIPLDQVYSPIRRVSYEVNEIQQAGEAYDSLALEVWTDGTISGSSAISEASDILVSQLTPFSLMTEGRLQLDVSPVSPILELPIEELALSQRVNNLLRRSKIATIGAVLEHSKEELLTLRNFGELGYTELISALETKGFPVPKGESESEVSTDVSSESASTAANSASDDNLVNDDEPTSALAAALRDAMKERSNTEER